MIRLVVGALTILLCVVQLHALTCINQPCTSPSRYCELRLDIHNRLHGACVNTSIHLTHHTRRCSGTSPPAKNSTCYCLTQNCVDTFQKIVKAGNRGLRCGGHFCDGHVEFCQLTTGSHGVQGNCISKTSVSHVAVCANQVSRQPCECNTQACIDGMFRAYNNVPHLDCHGIKCLIGEKCILSPISHRENSACVQTTNVPSCTNQTSTSSNQCSCDNQECIYEFILKSNIQDSHVRCGRDECRIGHHGEVCVLQNYGRIRHFCRDDRDKQFQFSSNNLCTSFPEVNEECICLNQVCVDSYSDVCSDAANKNLCDNYEGKNHMCESTNPQLLALALGRCAQYCKTCIAANSTLTTLSPEQVCSHVAYFQECDSYASNYNLCESNVFSELATGKCAEYCNKCPRKVPTTISASMTTQEVITTSKIDYPICVTTRCSKYYPYCHLYDFNSYVQARCVPFKVGKECTAVNDLIGQGCSCSTTSCSIDILSLHEKLVSHPTKASTLTTIATSTTTKSATGTNTDSNAYDCAGNICSSLKRYCHLFSYNGQLEGRCMPFSVWPLCHHRTDLVKSGCACTSPDCVKSIQIEVVSITSTMQTTVSPTTTSSTSTTTALPSKTTTRSIETKIPATTMETKIPPTTTVKAIETIMTSQTPDNKLISTTLYPITNEKTTTQQQKTTTVKESCQDKPGVDCMLLNSTNICANPFSHQYCAAFCGHCVPNAVELLVG